MAAAGLLLAATTLFATTTVAAAEGCEEQGDRCICTDNEGDAWDLTELASRDSTVTGPGPSVWTYTYHWNFCRDVPVASDCPTLPETAAYRREDFTGSSPVCQNMGPSLPAGPLSVAKLPGGQGLSIGYQQGSLSLTVDLEYDPDAGAGQPVPPDRFANAIVIRWPTRIKQKQYRCMQDQCVASEEGIDLGTCEAMCGAPPPPGYRCVEDTCVQSTDGSGVERDVCELVCGAQESAR